MYLHMYACVSVWTLAHDFVIYSQQTFLGATELDDELIKQLPKEVLLRVFSYLDVVSLCRCAQVGLSISICIQIELN